VAHENVLTRKNLTSTYHPLYSLGIRFLRKRTTAASLFYYEGGWSWIKRS